MANVAQKVQQLHVEHADFNQAHELLIENLAVIYEQSIRANSAAIMVQGKQEYIKKPFNVAKIRTQLLCGFRFAMLWRLYGGRRWRLLLNRKATVEECQKLLKEAPIKSGK